MQNVTCDHIFSKCTRHSRRNGNQILELNFEVVAKKICVRKEISSSNKREAREKCGTPRYNWNICIVVEHQKDSAPTLDGTASRHGTVKTVESAIGGHAKIKKGTKFVYQGTVPIELYDWFYTRKAHVYRQISEK